MRIRTCSILAGLATLLVAAPGCSEKEDAAQQGASEGGRPAETPRALVTFYPTRYFADRIGGDLVRVELPLPEGEDPIFWRPDADTVRAYQDADLVIINGAEFEKWAMTAPLARSRVVDTGAGFADEFIEYQSAVSHSHGPSGEHTHTGVDGHTWLDPNLAIAQTRAIERAFSELRPASAIHFETNRDELEFDLLALDRSLRDLTPRVAKVRLLASHPAYNYIAKRYGWTITNHDLDPGAPMGEAEVGEILRSAGSGGAAPIVMLWESEPLPETGALLESAGVRSVLFSPAENPSTEELQASGDYLAIMRANIRRLADALPE